MEKKHMKVTNRKQFEMLVSAMEQNLDVARGHGKSGIYKTDTKTFWSNLAIKLNSLGPPCRDGPGWLKVWNDQKYAVKQKLKHNNQQLKGTESGPNKPYILNTLEEIIANLLHLETIVSPKAQKEETVVTKTATENSAFGACISTEIDKLNPDLQISAKKQIFSIIMDLQAEQLKRNQN